MKKIVLIVIGLMVSAGLIIILIRGRALVPLAVIQTSVAPEATHNPFSPVIFYFNRPPKENEVVFSIEPTTDVVITASASGALVLSPKTTFQPSVVYRITALTLPPFSLQFETEQKENNTPGWNELNNAAKQQYLKAHGSQDEALSEIRTNAPIKQQGFQIDYAYKNNTYTVYLLAPYESNKSQFLSWIKQKGVSDLSSVRIVYVNK